MLYPGVDLEKCVRTWEEVRLVTNTFSYVGKGSPALYHNFKRDVGPSSGAPSIFVMNLTTAIHTGVEFSSDFISNRSSGRPVPTTLHSYAVLEPICAVPVPHKCLDLVSLDKWVSSYCMSSTDQSYTAPTPIPFSGPIT